MRVILNPSIDEYRGSMNRIVYKKVRGKIIAAPMPSPSESEPTPAQLAHQERFSEAAAYAQQTLADASTAEIYELAAKLKDKPAFALCVGDFLKPPTIKSVDTSAYHGQIGDQIKIKAVDNFGIVELRVEIGDGSSILESGSAVEGIAGNWVYTATTQINTGGNLDVKVTATDRPGGMAVKETNVDLS